MEVLLNSWEILVKELGFFNKISALQPANAIKRKFFTNRFPPFCVQDRTISIVFTVFCQRLFVPNLIILGVVLKRSFEENSCSKCLDKTEELQMKDSLLSKVA